jgi:hypothetical protein
MTREWEPSPSTPKPSTPFSRFLLVGYARLNCSPGLAAYATRRGATIQFW